MGALAAVLVVGLWAAPAVAEDVSAAEAAQRARAAAAGDALALDDLRRVTAIDGRPVDLDPVLTAPDRFRSARLTDLAEALDAGSSAGSTGDPGADSRLAGQVLDQDEYREPDLPRPFRRPLQWLGERIVAVWDAGVDLLSPVLGTRGAALALIALIGAGLVMLVLHLVGRATRTAAGGGAPGTGLLVDPSLDPARLEQRADDARRAGDHGAAVRLRYEAGLVRLVRAGRLRLRPETTPSDAAHQIDLPVMDALTEAFEEIVYGGRSATAVDDDAAVRGWREVLGTKVRP
ncbi:MAG: DUF4129 domain-containing protein [Actinobacteria bacterium]|nr:DUF4129 domain-containing protein [Actinomycetota bacterium]